MNPSDESTPRPHRHWAQLATLAAKKKRTAAVVALTSTLITLVVIGKMWAQQQCDARAITAEQHLSYADFNLAFAQTVGDQDARNTAKKDIAEAKQRLVLAQQCH